MDVISAIRHRRSIRRYKPDPVPDSELDILLEAARWAPSWANTQCRQLIVVRDPVQRERLGATVAEKNPARGAFQQAPVVLVLCARRGVSGFYKGQAATDKGDWYLFDAALAIQNLTLAAYARGLGTVHVGMFDAPAAAAVCAVPEDVAVVELLPLGYPEDAGAAPLRSELHEFVYSDAYGQARRT